VSISSTLSISIHKAPWVVPISSPVLQDGAVVVDGEQIIDVGLYSDIASRFQDIPVKNYAGVLLPALVNAHIHLELSVYGVVHPPSKSSTMCDWIRVLLKTREESQFSIAEVIDAAQKTAQEQYDSGVGLMLDIGNSDLGKFNSCPVEILSLREMLGPSESATKAAIEAIEKIPSEQAITGHSPYSTSPKLLQYIKNRCRDHNQIFSLHLGENVDEALLLTKGEGCFSEFLQERGSTDSPFPIPGIDSSAVVGYLQQLGILDSKTLCVHCVHLNVEELTILAGTKARVCLCPGSNKFLSVGTAPLEAMLDHDILPAIGTDSITSNPALDMWQEMALLRDAHPDVDSEHILCMVTLGGAIAMGRQNSYGSLEKGKTAKFINIERPEYQKASNAEQLINCLTTCGRPESVRSL
jgi:cytosine/adenosine deaminase-related metal-dependent hydrolase